MRSGSPKEAGHLSALLLGSLCLGVSVGCIVSPPSAEELVAVGFRTPEQTFRTFQTAPAGDLPDLEFSCLSVGFRNRNGISKLTYLEFRDELRKREPGFRYAIDKARILSVDRIGPDRCRVLARTLGRTLALEMVREDFYELWTEKGLADSGDAPFEASTRVVEGPEIYARAPIPEHVLPEDLIEISVRREWKIDGYEIRDEEPAASPAPDDTP